MTTHERAEKMVAEKLVNDGWKLAYGKYLCVRSKREAHLLSLAVRLQEELLKKGEA